MKSVEPPSSPGLASRMGLFATLAARVSVKGTRAPGIGFLALLTALATLALTATPALAAPPTVISESSSAVKATEARVEAVVNAGNEVTECHFQYGALSVSEHEVPCETPLIEGGEQTVAATLSGLAGHTPYVYRVVLKNLKAEEAVGEEQTFETATPPEAPETKPATGVSASAATLKGVLNPHSEAKDGWYFAYSNPGGSSCLEGPNAGQEPEVLAKELAEEKTVENLQPHQKYVFCLVAVNGARETTAGEEVPFETTALAPAMGEERLSGRKDSEVRPETGINPENSSTECHLEWGVESNIGEHVVPCEPATLEHFSEQGVGLTLTGLTPDTAYKYRFIAKNAAGTTEGKEETFTTSFAPAAEAKAPTRVTSTSALLQGVLNPAGAGETGHFHFIYLRSKSACEGEGELQTETQPVTGVQGQPAEAPAEQLLSDTSFTYCLVAENETGDRVVSAPVTFRTPPQAYATEVFTSTAKLHAAVNPEGVSTTYTLEYAPPGEAFEPVPGGAGSAGEGSEPVSFEAQLEGLKPGRAYRYRLTVTNTASETFHSDEGTFTTPEAPTPPATGSCPNETRRAEQPFDQALPDCRAYELVSPANTEGQDATNPAEDVHETGAEPARAAVSGDAVTYTAVGAFAEPHGAEVLNQFLSRREPEHDRWSTRSITAPGDAWSLTNGPGYWGSFFTPELTAGLTTSQASLGPDASKGLMELYRADLEHGSFTWLSQLAPSEEPYAEQYSSEAGEGEFSWRAPPKGLPTSCSQ